MIGMGAYGLGTAYKRKTPPIIIRNMHAPLRHTHTQKLKFSLSIYPVSTYSYVPTTGDKSAYDVIVK